MLTARAPVSLAPWRSVGNLTVVQSWQQQVARKWVTNIAEALKLLLKIRKTAVEWKESEGSRT